MDRGVAVALTAVVGGMVALPVIIDQFGLLGLDKDPISAMKAVGVLLLAAGTLLIVRG